jgi:3-dehydro-L-gulonate 2-dehydrogenase
MQRIPFQTLYDEFNRVLMKAGFSDERAALCARLFAENQRDGVYSHGLNRFPGFVTGIKLKQIDIHARPEKVESLGDWLLERVRVGPGAGRDGDGALRGPIYIPDRATGG